MLKAADADADGKAVARRGQAVGKIVNAAVLPPEGRAGEVVALHAGAGVEVVERKEAAVRVAVEALLAAVDGLAGGKQRRQFFIEEAGEGFGLAAVGAAFCQRRGVVAAARVAVEQLSAGVADADEQQRLFFAVAGRVEQGAGKRQSVGEVIVAVQQVKHGVAFRRCCADGAGLDAVAAAGVGGGYGGFFGLRQLCGAPVGGVGSAAENGGEEHFFHGFSR